MLFLQGDRTEVMKSYSVFGLCACLILCLIGAAAASGADNVSDAELVRDIEDHRSKATGRGTDPLCE